jgi:DNA adenine methylase
MDRKISCDGTNVQDELDSLKKKMHKLENLVVKNENDKEVNEPSEISKEPDMSEIKSNAKEPGMSKEPEINTKDFCKKNKLDSRNVVLMGVCKKLGLNIGGKKELLLSRLDDYFKQHPEKMTKERFVNWGPDIQKKLSNCAIEKSNSLRSKQQEQFISQFNKWHPIFIHSLCNLDDINFAKIITHFKPIFNFKNSDKKKLITNPEVLINKSPLRYPGGKTRACKTLDIVLNKYFNVADINTLYSPFFGGGSFEFHLQNNYKFNIIANDKFTPLYNFWNTCVKNKKALCFKLYETPSVSKEEFLNYRKQIMNEKDTLKQSYYYFIINRCSFSGATLSGGFSQESSDKRYTKSSIDRIDDLNLSNCKFYNSDFTEFIKNINGNKYLIFLDPPYYLEKGSKLYGNKGDMHENFDHISLSNILKNKKCWLMTYNDCKYIRDLYKDYTIINVDWKYGMNKSKKSSEIVILNK